MASGQFTSMRRPPSGAPRMETTQTRRGPLCLEMRRDGTGEKFDTCTSAGCRNAYCIGSALKFGITCKNREDPQSSERERTAHDGRHPRKVEEIRPTLFRASPRQGRLYGLTKTTARTQVTKESNESNFMSVALSQAGPRCLNKEPQKNGVAHSRSHTFDSE